MYVYRPIYFYLFILLILFTLFILFIDFSYFSFISEIRFLRTATVPSVILAKVIKCMYPKLQMKKKIKTILILSVKVKCIYNISVSYAFCRIFMIKT